MAAFESSRMFQVWSFSASHRTMLLRSNPTNLVASETRIEIYIGNVEIMYIKSAMDGLRIWRPVDAEAGEAISRFQLHGAEDLYLIESGSFSGFLVGGRPSWREAVCGLDSPSLFDFGSEWPPGDDVRWGDVE